MNKNQKNHLLKKKIMKANKFVINPIEVKIKNLKKKIFKMIAVNEISLLRQSKQTANLQIKVNQKNLIKQLITISILAIVALGVIRPLLSRMLVPVGSGVAGEIVSGMDDDIDLDTIEVKEGESLEDIKAKLKPKKQAISAEMLDTANTYDDKVAVIRMIVQDESGRVSNVFKNMIQRDMN